MYAESLEACTQFCAGNNECAAASYVGGKGAGHCYLKGTKNDANPNDGVDGTFEVLNFSGDSAVLTSNSGRCRGCISYSDPKPNFIFVFYHHDLQQHICLLHQYQLYLNPDAYSDKPWYMRRC